MLNCQCWKGEQYPFDGSHLPPEPHPTLSASHGSREAVLMSGSARGMSLTEPSLGQTRLSSRRRIKGARGAAYFLWPILYSDM